MDNRSEVRDFLTSRRARLNPEQVGLTSRGARRVAGLRRAEVAQDERRAIKTLLRP